VLQCVGEVASDPKDQLFGFSDPKDYLFEFSQAHPLLSVDKPNGEVGFILGL
jgi:hypothetical protein